VALLLGIGIHHPRHHALVGSEIGCRNIAIRADDLDDLRCVASRQALEFVARECVWVDAHTTLRAAEGQVHQRALPRHPDRKGRYFSEVDVLVVSDAPLGGSHREQVLHAVCEDRLDRFVVVASKREGHDVSSLWSAQPFPDVRIQVHLLGGLVELVDREPVHRCVPLQRRVAGCSLGLRIFCVGLGGLGTHVGALPSAQGGYSWNERFCEASGSSRMAGRPRETRDAFANPHTAGTRRGR